MTELSPTRAAVGGRASRYVGRVGALAVALGIGAAVMTAPGIAFADPDTGASASGADAAQQSSPPDSASATAEEAPGTSAVTDTAIGSATDSPPATAPADRVEGTVQASGGANSSVKTSDASPDTSVAEASDTAAALLAATTAEDPTEADDSNRTKRSSTVVNDADRPRLTSTVPDEANPADAQPISDTARIGPVTSDPPRSAAATVALIEPSPESAAAPVDPVTAVVRRVVSVAAGLASIGLSPSEAPHPVPPVEPPVTWVLLAWVRRQVEDVLYGASTHFGFGPVTTSQSDTGVVSGKISTIGPASAPVALQVTAGPANGTVVVNPSTGEFEYTPNEALARSGGIDTFTVAASTPSNDSARNALRDFVAAVVGARRGEPATATVLVSVLPAGATGPDPTTLDASELVELVADGKVALTANKNGTVRAIDGSFTDSVVRTDDDAARVMNSIARLLGAPADFADDAAIGVQALGQAGGDPSEVIYRLQPTVHGIPTLNSQVVLVTDGQGTVTGVFSSYDSRVNDVDVTATDLDDESVALAAARAALLDTLIRRDDPDPSAVLAAVSMASELVIYDVDPDIAPRLARRVTVFSSVVPTDHGLDPLRVVSTDYYVYADGADTGDVIVAISNLQDASTTWVSVSTTAKDLRKVTRTISVEYQRSSATYRANDVVRKVSTYVASSTSTVPGKIATKGWWWGWDASAVSAHANTEVVWDYYQKSLSRKSFDGLGSAVRVSVLPKTLNNAYWDSSVKTLVFGHDTEAALDVVGHEFTHGVIDYAVANGNGLLYQKESGALSESYADILGSLIENKTGTGRWLIAEDYGCGRSSCALRDMSKPSRYGQPENYQNRYTGTADYGGVHTNSGIFNFAAYKMMVDSRTTGVSSTRWANVFYGSLFKLSSSATFLDARAAVLNSARSQGFTASQLQAVADAFTAVGIK